MATGCANECTDCGEAIDENSYNSNIEIEYSRHFVPYDHRRCYTCLINAVYSNNGSLELIRGWKP